MAKSINPGKPDNPGTLKSTNCFQDFQVNSRLAWMVIEIPFMESQLNCYLFPRVLQQQKLRTTVTVRCKMNEIRFKLM